MALINHTDSELGQLVVNTETGLFVAGFLNDHYLELWVEGENEGFRQGTVEDQEVFNKRILDEHTRIVNELTKWGYGTDFNEL